MRYLIFGATGMAGHMVALYLKELGHEVIGVSRRPAPFLDCYAEIDVFNRRAVQRVIDDHKPDVVVNCIGALVAECEAFHDRAIYLNAYLPHLLASICSKAGTRVIHLSTDCIYRGNTGPYYEYTRADAEEFYGRTKALGELNDNQNLTLRQSIVGPDISKQGIGLLNWFMGQEGSIGGWTGAMWSGMTTLELAKAVEACSRSSYAGIINMVPPGSGISKYDLLQLFNCHIRRMPIEIVPDSHFVCDKVLTSAREDSPYTPSDYERQVVELAEWIRGHRMLYPHYDC